MNKKCFLLIAFFTLTGQSVLARTLKLYNHTAQDVQVKAFYSDNRTQTYVLGPKSKVKGNLVPNTTLQTVTFTYNPQSSTSESRIIKNIVYNSNAPQIRISLFEGGKFGIWESECNHHACDGYKESIAELITQ